MLCTKGNARSILSSFALLLLLLFPLLTLKTCVQKGRNKLSQATAETKVIRHARQMVTSISVSKNDRRGQGQGRMSLTTTCRVPARVITRPGRLLVARGRGRKHKKQRLSRNRPGVGQAARGGVINSSLGGSDCPPSTGRSVCHWSPRERPSVLETTPQLLACRD